MYFMMCKNTSADINDCFIYFSSSKLCFKGLTLQLIKKSIILASIAILVVPFIAAAFAYVQTPIICAVMLGLSAIGTAVTLRINLSLFLSDYCFFETLAHQNLNTGFLCSRTESVCLHTRHILRLSWYFSIRTVFSAGFSVSIPGAVFNRAAFS